MIGTDGPARSHAERYRDFMCETAELVAGDAAGAEFVERAIASGRSFFGVRTLEITMREPALSGGAFAGPDDARAAYEFAKHAVLRAVGQAPRPGATSLHVPIGFDADVRGVISIAADGGFDAVEIEAFDRWGRLVAVRVRDLYLQVANGRLERLAGIDALTGIRNRRAFGETLTQAWQRAAQSGASLAIAMIDIDFFKAYNDRYGHGAGDACLKAIAGAITTALREDAVVGRYGGEEFVVCFEAASLETAIVVSERLRENILALDVPHAGSSLERVSASVGVAATIPRAGEDPDALLERADHALYEAKGRGRNRVVAGSYVSNSKIAAAHHLLRTNLPIATTSFCAREDDAARLRSALDRSRCVTLTGFGGVGKSRLAIAVALEAVKQYRDGVWYVDLAGTRDTTVIPSLFATVMGMGASDAAQGAAAFAERCAQKSILLVLDNCEHLKSACATFSATVLHAAPQVRILVTSREPLEHANELVLPVGAFAVPERDDLDVSLAMQYPAVRLFVDRANAVTPFVLREETLGAVVDLCRRVDGIALGIELAAARLKMLTLDQLSSKLDQRFEVLGRGDASVPERQQTLRAVIDWSVGLLSAVERTLLHRLGIFAGSFTFEAAAAVCADEDSDADVLDVLDALVDKSLVLVEAKPGDRRTFRLFESIRSYARDRLAAAGELDEMAARHRDYYVATAAASYAKRLTPHWHEALEPLEFAGDDLRAVLERTLGERCEPEIGARLAVTLLDHWYTHGAVREARAWFGCALRVAAELDFPSRLVARLRAGVLELQMPGDSHAMIELAKCVLATIDEGQADDDLRCATLFFLGNAYINVGEMELARHTLDAALGDAQTSGDNLNAARASNSLGILGMVNGDDAEATKRFADSERLFRMIGRMSRTAFPLGNLADLARVRGRFAESVEVGKRALAISEYHRDRACVAWLLANVGSAYLGMADLVSAASFTLDGIRAAAEIDDVFQVCANLDTYAQVENERGNHEQAARIVGHTDRVLADLAIPRQPEEQTRVEELRKTLASSLGKERMRACTMEGRALTQPALLASLDFPRHPQRSEREAIA